MTSTLAVVSTTGELQSALNVTVSRLYYTPPPTITLNSANGTTNATFFATTTTTSTTSTVNIIGTAAPTGNPTYAPTRQPTIQPSSRPTNPTFEPTARPSKGPATEKGPSSMIIIIIAVAVTGGVLIVGAIAGYFMSSRAKLTAIIPHSSAGVVTATTTGTITCSIGIYIRVIALLQFAETFSE